MNKGMLQWIIDDVGYAPAPVIQRHQPARQKRTSRSNAIIFFRRKQR